MQLHAEEVLLPLLGLVHLGIALALVVLGRAWRRDDGGIHDGADADLHALALQNLADLGEQGCAQLVLVVLEQAAELQQRRTVGHTLAAQVNAHEAAQRRAVQQRFFAGFVGQVEPVLHEVHA